jgi:hypothetical protein
MVRNPGTYRVDARTQDGCLATGMIRVSLSIAGGAASGDGTIEAGGLLQLRGDLWDGTFRGQPLPAGIYYYILRVDEDDLFIKQAPTLVRD